MKKILKILKIAGCTVLLLIVAFEAVVLGVRLIGGRAAVAKLPVYIWRISSDSMYPKLQSGSCILGVSIPFEWLKPGDIITYASNGDWITHEVVRVNEDNTVTTKGLANSYEDGRISEQEYVGKMVTKLPLLNTFLWLTQGVIGKLVWILLVLLVCFGYPVGVRLVGRHKNKKTAAAEEAAETIQE